MPRPKGSKTINKIKIIVKKECECCGKIFAKEVWKNIANNLRFCSQYCRDKQKALRNYYNITYLELLSMLDEQDWKCQICYKNLRDIPFKNINVDHDHRTGLVRSALCNTCNSGLGSFKDNPKLLRFAAKYLELHS